jgi:excisionase family DNA binding protein
MKPAEVMQEIREMRFESIYDRRIKRELTVEEAAELLGIHERTFRRWAKKYARTKGSSIRLTLVL